MPLQEKETKTPVSVKSVKKEVAAVANDVATPVVEAVVKRVSTPFEGFLPSDLHILS